MSTVTVRFMLRGDVRNGSRTFHREQTSQETKRKLLAASRTKAGLPFASAAYITAAASSVLCTEHQASQALEASMPPALKSNLSST